jgi:hypothetical protein
MSKHTPGTWTVDPYGSEPAIRLNDGHVLVPRVWGSVADAHLMAAAPKLEASCLALLAYVQMLKDHIVHLDGPGCYIPDCGGREKEARALVESLCDHVYSPAHGWCIHCGASPVR